MSIASNKSDRRVTVFRKSSFSGTGNCLEWATPGDGTVLVRDSKELVASGQVLRFTRDEWDAFIKGVMNHEFDL